MKILKIGGSVITDKSGFKKPNNDNIKKMAKVIAEIWKKEKNFIVVHGAGSFGHPLVINYNIDNGINSDENKYGYAVTHFSCRELSKLFLEAILEEGVPAISLSSDQLIITRNKRIEIFRMDIVRNYMLRGFLPIIHGDMVPDSEITGAVCSGDQIVSYLGNNSELIVLATDVDGVLDEKGKLISEVKSIKDIETHLKENKNDVTGSMKGKIMEILSIGTPSFIVNAKYPDRIIKLMKGEKAISTKVYSK